MGNHMFYRIIEEEKEEHEQKVVTRTLLPPAPWEHPPSQHNDRRLAFGFNRFSSSFNTKYPAGGFTFFFSQTTYPTNVPTPYPSTAPPTPYPSTAPTPDPTTAPTASPTQGACAFALDLNSLTSPYKTADPGPAPSNSFTSAERQSKQLAAGNSKCKSADTGPLYKSTTGCANKCLLTVPMCAAACRDTAGCKFFQFAARTPTTDNPALGDVWTKHALKHCASDKAVSTAYGSLAAGGATVRTAC